MSVSPVADVAGSLTSDESITLQFKDIKAWVPNYKQTLPDGSKEIVTRVILRGVSGSVQSGGLTMLMGASGAGKTTLFDVLTHRTSKAVRFSGSMTVNGADFDLVSFQSIAAYVTQDSHFVPHLTVRESLEFQAKLRLGSALSATERRERVDNALALLHLQTLASNIVGTPGDARALNTAARKKLSIAMALLSNPSVLFCDEPTTGLDATTARSVVESLREIARKQRILVFCTIHQPSVHVYNMFDNALVMALGQMAYSGTVANLVPALAAVGHKCGSRENPADFIIGKLSTRSDADKEAVQSLIHALRGSSGAGSAETSISESAQVAAAKHVSTVVSGSVRPNFFSRTSALVWRNIMVTLRSDKALRVNIAQAIVLGLVLGFIYFKSPRSQTGVTDRVGLAFLVAANQMFLGVQQTIMVAVAERAVFLKETADGSYDSLDYLLAKFIAQVPFAFLYPATFVAVLYFIVGFQANVTAFFTWVLFACLVMLCGNSFGLMLSIMTGDVATANALTPAIGIPSMLFSGFLVATPNIVVWLRWLRYLSMIRYTLSALMITELSGITFSCKADERTASGQCPIDNGTQYIEQLGVDEGGRQMYKRYVPLIALNILALFCAYLSMVYQVWKAKKK